MSGFLLLEIVITFLLILANGFFSATEIAIVSARHSRLQQQIDEGNKRAQVALDLAEHPDRFLATVQVGITLISTLAAAFSGANLSSPLASWISNIHLLAPYAQSIALAAVVILLTYFTLVLGELVPKSLALRSSERIAMSSASFMVALSALLRPIIALLNGSVRLVLTLLGVKQTTTNPVTEEDIVYLAREGIASGTVERGESELINRVFRFTDRSISAILTPRTEIVAIEVGTPLPEVIQTFVTSGKSRIPLYQDTLDNIIGVLYAKDLLIVRGSTNVDLAKIAHPPFFVSEYQHADDLLTQFRRNGIHLGIVVDEYSQVVGLVTLEDMLEELVGEIKDEYDRPEAPPFVKRDDGSWLVDAMVPHEEVWEKTGFLPPPEEEEGRSEYHTLAGMILAYMGRIPIVGDKVNIGNATFEVVDMDGRRIDKVLIRRRT
jgi:putative hemolysin